MTDDEVIDSSINDVIVEETRFHPLVEKVNERSVVSVKEVTKKNWSLIVALLGMNYGGKEHILLDYGYHIDKVKHNL